MTPHLIALASLAVAAIALTAFAWAHVRRADRHIDQRLGLRR